MIGSLLCHCPAWNVAGPESRSQVRRCEDEIKPQPGKCGGIRKPHFPRMERPIAVRVSGISYEANCVARCAIHRVSSLFCPLWRSTNRIAGSEGIEVTDQD